MRKYEQKPEVRVGSPYTVSFRNRSGYMIGTDGQIGFACFRESSGEKELWRQMTGRDDEAPIRDKEALIEILAHRMMEMSMLKTERLREIVGYPLESIWWHPLLNLCDREWESLVEMVPRPTMISVTPAHNNHR